MEKRREKGTKNIFFDVYRGTVSSNDWGGTANENIGKNDQHFLVIYD